MASEAVARLSSAIFFQHRPAPRWLCILHLSTSVNTGSEEREREMMRRVMHSWVMRNESVGGPERRITESDANAYKPRMCCSALFNESDRRISQFPCPYHLIEVGRAVRGGGGVSSRACPKLGKVESRLRSCERRSTSALCSFPSCAVPSLTYGRACSCSHPTRMSDIVQ